MDQGKENLLVQWGGMLLTNGRLGRHGGYASIPISNYHFHLWTRGKNSDVMENAKFKSS